MAMNMNTMQKEQAVRNQAGWRRSREKRLVRRSVMPRPWKYTRARNTRR
jgi:hypothetical protein